MTNPQYDVVVVGAGPAGAASAYQLARRGLKTCLVERQEFAAAGPGWTNTVARWMFERAGVAPPEPPERIDVARRVMAVTPPQILDPEPVLHVQMRSLVERLQALARSAGAELIDRTEIEELEQANGRPTGLAIRRGDAVGGGDKLTAHLFVDASGMAAVLRQRCASLAPDCPAVAPHDLCSAAHYVYAVRDPERARAFFAGLGAEPRDRLCFVGVAGGYSTQAISLDEGCNEIGLLTGAAVVEDRPSGAQLNDSFVAAQSWVGERRHGGGGPIPIRRPYDRLAAPGLVLVGNAGCQVFPAHGSGVGPALVAAAILGETVSRYSDPGSEAATWAYQAAFHRELGAVLGAYDAFRRMSQGFTGEEAQALFSLGLSTAENTQAALTQRMPAAGVREAARSLALLSEAPRLARRVVPTALKMKRIHGHYKKFPTEPDREALRRWSRRAARFFGEKPDVTG